MSDDPKHPQPKLHEVATPTPSPFHSAYFYYIKYNTNGTRDIKTYEYFDIDNPINDIDGLALSLLGNAINNQSHPPCYSKKIEELTRCRKGYVIVAAEGKTFQDSDPIKFILTASDYADANINGSSAAYTFAHLYNLSVKLKGRSLSIAIYINNLQSSSGKGNLREKEWEDFRVECNFVETASDDAFLQAGPYLDSGGTNMGPPVPPPQMD